MKISQNLMPEIGYCANFSFPLAHLANVDALHAAVRNKAGDALVALAGVEVGHDEEDTGLGALQS